MERLCAREYSCPPAVDWIGTGSIKKEKDLKRESVKDTKGQKESLAAKIQGGESFATKRA